MSRPSPDAAARLSALRATGLLDTPAEPAFDRFTRLAGTATGAPVALLTLVDDERQFVKSVHAAGGPWASRRETPLSHSFCCHVVAGGEPLAIDDARTHELVRGNPAIEELGVVAYAGAPVRDGAGHVLGTLCVIESRPRAWSDADVALIAELAVAAGREIELRVAAVALEDAERRHLQLVEQLPTVTYVYEFEGDEPRVRYVSPQLEAWTGYPSSRWIEDPRFWRHVVHPDDRERLLAQVTDPGGDRPASREYRIVGADGRVRHILDREVLTRDESGRPLHSQGVLVDVTDTHAAQSAVAESDRLHRAVLEALEEGVLVVDDDARVVHCNTSAERILGLEQERIVGRMLPFFTVAHEDGRPLSAHTSPALEALRSGRRRHDVPLAIPHNGRLMSVSYLPLAEGGMVISFTDVTERRAAERALRESEERFRTVVEGADLVMFALDADGVFTLSEGRALSALGRDPGESVGRSVFEIHADSPQIVDACRRALDGERVTAIVEVGDLLFEAYYNPIFDAAGDVVQVIGTATDVTERRRTEERVAHLAYHDPLTGLANRFKLEDHLAPTLARARREARAAALVALDLDEFKVVNDSLGHTAGDELLCQVAQRLSDRTRASDLLARHGGDEFVLLLGDLGADAREVAESVAADLLERLRAPFVVRGAEFEIGASAGIALYPRHGEYAPELLKRADAAMYQAKRDARGGVALYSAGRDDNQRRLTLSARLRRAVAQDELVLHYQPIWDLPAGRPTGVEALVRWCDPERGLIAPGDFIPFAEESGLIEPIGEWVVEALLAQAQEWEAQGVLPQLSFNVAPRQLRACGFAPRLAERIARSGVDARRLTVEITESTLLQDPERTDAVLRELGDLGLVLSIDDFGTDYASLARLRELPFTELKLDRSFLRAVPADGAACRLVGAVLDLATALGMRAVVEGIETVEQRDFLLERGCRWGQGYLLAHPLGASEATELLLAPDGAAAAAS